MDLGTILLTAFLTWLVEKFANVFFDFFTHRLGKGHFLEENEEKKDKKENND